MKNKKASHVGMILSFVLFVTSVIFLYEIISPSIKTEEDKSELINYIEEKIPSYLEDTLYNQKISLKEELDKGVDCIKISKNNLAKNTKSLVKDSEGNNLISEDSDEFILIKNSEKSYFNIFLSKDGFKQEIEDLEGCDLIDSEEYTSAFNYKEYYFQSKIESFLFDISSDEKYSKIKKEILLPEGTEFSIVFVYNNGSKIGRPPKEDISTNIFVEQIPIYYIDFDAKINSGYLEIGVW